MVKLGNQWQIFLECVYGISWYVVLLLSQDRRPSLVVEVVNGPCGVGEKYKKKVDVRKGKEVVKRGECEISGMIEIALRKIIKKFNL